MRTVLLLLLAMLAIKTTSTTSALGQEACSKSYVSCVDKCVARPSKTLQDSCMEACQTQNNACFSQLLGGPGSGTQTVQQEPGPAKDALAAEGERPAVKSAKPAQSAKPAKTTKKPERRAQ